MLPFKILTVLLIATAGAAAKTSSSELANHIQFRYMTSDGGFQLSCKHLPNMQIESDFDVYCGKETPTLKQYLVHLILRPVTVKPTETTYEILYWVTDRTQGPRPAFSSTSQLITLDQSTNLKRLSLSQSLENDAAQLYLEYRP